MEICDFLKVNSENIRNINLDSKLSELYSFGTIFEGLPYVRYSEKPINWQLITSEIRKHHGPMLPFKYLSEEKDRAYVDLGSEERGKRTSKIK